MRSQWVRWKGHAALMGEIDAREREKTGLGGLFQRCVRDEN